MPERFKNMKDVERQHGQYHKPSFFSAKLCTPLDRIILDKLYGGRYFVAGECRPENSVVGADGKKVLVRHWYVYEALADGSIKQIAAPSFRVDAMAVAKQRAAALEEEEEEN